MLFHNLTLKRQLLFIDKPYLSGGERVFSGTLSVKRYAADRRGNGGYPVPAFNWCSAAGWSSGRAGALEYLRGHGIWTGFPGCRSSTAFTIWHCARLLEGWPWTPTTTSLSPGLSLPDVLLPPENQRPPTMEVLLNVGLGTLPLPDEVTPLEDVLAFRHDLRDKQWSFRRFLRQLATKQLTQAEIQDEVEYLANEYRKAMAVHRVKALQSFVDVFVISPLEIVENLVKFNWSKIAKGALSIKKRKIELLEAEMKAPGRECAYVFEARERFGNSESASAL